MDESYGAHILFNMYPINGYDSWLAFLHFVENSEVWKKGKVHFGTCTKRKDILCCVCAKEEYHRVARVLEVKLGKKVLSKKKKIRLEAVRFPVMGLETKRKYIEKLLGKELEKIKSYGKDNKKKDKR